MAPDDDSGDDTRALRERVRDLEATVSEQQDTIQKLMPSRRQVLASGALLGGGLLGGSYVGSQRASAQAAGQVGTSSDPVNVEAYNLNVQGGVDVGGSDVTNVGSLDAGSLNTINLQTQQSDTILQNPVIDDFESASLDYYSGQDTGSLVIDTSTYLHGSQSVLIDNQNVRGSAGVDGSRGWEYVCYVYMSSAASGDKTAPIALNFQDVDTFYTFRARVDNDKIGIIKTVAGTVSSLGSASVSLSEDKWYEHRVRHGFEETVFSLREVDGADLASVTMTDQALTGGEWGVGAFGNRSCNIDWATRRPL